MKFQDFTLDFDIFDADDADRYGTAAEKVHRRCTETVSDESPGDAIRRQCHIVFDFFDELFGDGFHKELFGQRTNLLVCIQTFRAFVNAIDQQKAEITTLMPETQPKQKVEIKRAWGR